MNELLYTEGVNRGIREPGLIELLQRGGIYQDIPGTSPQEVLTHTIQTITLPASITPEDLLQAVLEREALMSTAVGNGIALPHPRNPLISGLEEQCVIIGFLRQPVDWKALDGQKVHTLLLIVSSSAKSHLHTLSRLSFFCQQEAFRSHLRNRASLEHIIKTIQAIEQTWN
ncbi:MAG: PTS sugar transporter subunit IIA [Treponema sp.]|jgi:PTS system nitrogen regulatory IIA component|nr:PTS sugar transporter subunit IIA [Treponema sp.]